MGRFAIRAVIGVACVAFVLGACGGSTTAVTSTSTPAANTSSPVSSPTSTLSPAQIADLQVKEGIHAIEVALQSWAVSQPSPHYPAHATRIVLSKTMSDPWPANPFTGRAMRPGSGRGDYEYKRSANRKQFTVTSRLSDGSLYAGQTLRIQ